MWSATSKAFSTLLSSKSFQWKSHGTMIRWPDDEIGRNSVSPWTMPRMMAWMMGKGAHWRSVGGRRHATWSRRHGDASRCGPAAGRRAESAGCARHDAGPPRSVGIGVVADDPTEPELGQEVGRPVEVGHLDVGRAEGVGHVGVAAGPGRQPVPLGEGRRTLVQVGERRLGVEDLDGVDQTRRDQRVQRRRRPGCDAWGRTGGGRRPRRPGPGSGPAASSGGTPNGTCSDRNRPISSPACVRSSSPTTTRHGSRRASSTAPLTALWSVMHSTSIPEASSGLGQLILGGGRVARPHRVAVQVDPDPAVGLGFRQVRVPGDGVRPRGGHRRLRRRSW